MSSVPREVLRFAVPGILAVFVVATASLFFAIDVSTDEAVRDARGNARLLARGVVQPAVTDDLVAGDEDALRYLDAVVDDRVLDDTIVSVRLWTPDGRVVYAEDPDLIGRRFELGEDERQILVDGGAEAEVSDLSKPENASQRRYGELLEVYQGIRTPSGEPLLFELYQRQSTIESRARDVLGGLMPLVVVPLVLLLAVELTLAWRMARRLDQSTREREDLLQAALDASEAERRRIAADLHDGVVQDLVGVTYTLAALADTAAASDAPDQAGRLSGAEADTRRSVRSLRSLLVEIYPPNLTEAGLAAALSDLAAAHVRDGRSVDVEVDPAVELADGDQAVVYRVAREALQNVAKHADARQVVVRLAPAGAGAGAVLTVVDDGRGFEPGSVAEGHVGLRLLADLAREHGADLAVTSAPGDGTTVRLAVGR